jgi:hypothetical protein
VTGLGGARRGRGQLFKESTEDAASRGLMVEGMANPAMMADVLKSERCGSLAT